MHALTGWIPERSAIRVNEADFNADALFESIRKSLENGNLLATVATGELSTVEEERTGLVSTHAYAVFDAKIINVSTHFSNLTNSFLSREYVFFFLIGSEIIPIKKSMVTFTMAR